MIASNNTTRQLFLSTHESPFPTFVKKYELLKGSAGFCSNNDIVKLSSQPD